MSLAFVGLMIDDVIEEYADALGDDRIGFSNHAYRVANFALGLSVGTEIEKISIASAFHDLGIWTEGTLDYLGPSERLARDYVAHIGKPEWADEVGAMVSEHHRVRPAPQGGLVEIFRKADWTDVTRGVLSFGISREQRRFVFASWPDAGYHAKLARLVLARLPLHPTNPLPMVKF